MQVTELRKIQQSATSALNNSVDETDASSPLLLDNTVIEVTKTKARKPSESEKLLAEAAKKLEYVFVLIIPKISFLKCKK